MNYPPPPPKVNKAPLIAVLIAITLLLCAGGVTAVVLAVNKATDNAKEAIKIPDVTAPDVTTSGPAITVEYEVTGDGPAQILYVDEGGQKPQLTNQDLPWRKTITVQGVGLVSILAGRLGVSDGDISCSIKVDGEQVAQKTGTGNLATTECSKVLS